MEVYIKGSALEAEARGRGRIRASAAARLHSFVRHSTGDPTQPARAADVFGYALHLAQTGGRHDQAKPLRGFGSAGVLEVVEAWRGDAYRAVYTVRYSARVFVLHVF